ncbi:MAG: septal ring lytic transglycosylase RlpA family protein [Pseudomonadota bacterium]
MSQAPLRASARGIVACVLLGSGIYALPFSAFAQVAVSAEADLAADPSPKAPAIDRAKTQPEPALPPPASTDPFVAAFDDHLDPPGSAPSAIDLSVPNDAVDLASFEPPRGPTVLRSLGTGVASYYGRRFHGRLTANGERFDMGAMTAAHRTLPFGSFVRVTNSRNGLSVTVRINDRGPFIQGRSIDLSRAAAEEIGMIQAGHQSVEMELVAP